jgi:hypothetical protein
MYSSFHAVVSCLILVVLICVLALLVAVFIHQVRFCVRARENANSEADVEMDTSVKECGITNSDREIRPSTAKEVVACFVSVSTAKKELSPPHPLVIKFVKHYRP